MWNLFHYMRYFYLWIGLARPDIRDIFASISLFPPKGLTENFNPISFTLIVSLSLQKLLLHLTLLRLTTLFYCLPLQHNRQPQSGNNRIWPTHICPYPKSPIFRECGTLSRTFSLIDLLYFRFTYYNSHRNLKVACHEQEIKPEARTAQQTLCVS